MPRRRKCCQIAWCVAFAIPGQPFCPVHAQDRMFCTKPVHEALCADCKGKGGTMIGACEKCKGRGLFKRKPCPECKGTGNTYRATCMTCGGSGKAYRQGDWRGP